MGHADNLAALKIGVGESYRGGIDATDSEFEQYVERRADEEFTDSGSIADAIPMYALDPAVEMIWFAGKRMPMLEALIEYAPPSLRGAVVNALVESDGFRHACDQAFDGPFRARVIDDVRVDMVLRLAKRWAVQVTDAESRAYARGMLVGRMQARTDLNDRWIGQIVAEINTIFGA